MLIKKESFLSRIKLINLKNKKERRGAQTRRGGSCLYLSTWEAEAEGSASEQILSMWPARLHSKILSQKNNKWPRMKPGTISVSSNLLTYYMISHSMYHAESSTCIWEECLFSCWWNAWYMSIGKYICIYFSLIFPLPYFSVFFSSAWIINNDLPSTLHTLSASWSSLHHIPSMNFSVQLLCF
jgi:hypothetical protein